jgi:hypothetical protein
MARIVGSSFKDVSGRRSGPQESSMDRALASFVSPQGAYLLAQGIGALGKIPFRSKEGGLGLIDEAAKKKAAAIKQLKDAQATSAALKPGASQRDVVSQRDRMAPRDTDKMPDTLQTPTQRAFSAEIEAIEGQKKLQLQRATQLEMLLGNMSPDDPDRATVVDQRRQALGIISELKEAQDKLRPKDKAAKVVDTKVRELSDHMRSGVSSETRGGTVIEDVMLNKIAQARSEGREATKEELSPISEEMIRDKMAEDFTAPEVPEGGLSGLSDRALIEFAAKNRDQNRQFQASSRQFQEKYGEQIDPFIVQQNVERSIQARQRQSKAIRKELEKRRVAASGREAKSFLSERGQSLMGMTPFQQKQALRRMARAVKTQEDSDEVMNLLGQFKPARETVGDYFRSDDDIATEFEKEVAGLIPSFDPDAAQKRRLREVQIGKAEAGIAQAEAATEKLLEEKGQGLKIAKIQATTKRVKAEAEAQAKRAAKEEKKRNKASAESKAKHASLRKEATAEARRNANNISDPILSAQYFQSAMDTIDSAKPGQMGTAMKRVSRLFIKNSDIQADAQTQIGARKAAEAERARLKEYLDKNLEKAAEQG